MPFNLHFLLHNKKIIECYAYTKIYYLIIGNIQSLRINRRYINKNEII